MASTIDSIRLKRSTSSRSSCLTTLLFTLTFASIMIVEAQLMICPQVCSCIWRNGKQTTICENQNLISIPNQISPSTQVLDLNSNNFQILPSKAFQERGLINLQKLFLPRCKLGAIAEDAFVQLTNLVELDLSDNLLTHVPVKALANTTNLRRLLLNGNHIATINAESFTSLNNLKFLNLSGCQTHTIEPRAFWGLHDLEYLYLHSNHLTTLPASVVQDLPALYSFDLYRNPWHCNCEMRATREWMVRNNVGQSIPPACESPVRLSGLMWNSLDLDDFACEPDIITTTVEVAKTTGSNATLTCLVKGLPEPKIFWYVDDGFYRNLSSPAVRGEKYLLTEERTEGTVSSVLTIVGLDLSDDSGSFICSAENRAGMKSKNFTVFVMPSSAFGVTANWSKVELAGGIVGILISLVLAFVLITLILIRSKRFSNALSNAKKLSNNGDGMNNSGDNNSMDKKPPMTQHLSALLKNNNQNHNLIYPAGGGGNMNMAHQYGYSQTSIPQHLSMLGLDGIEKKPEIFLQPGYGNGQTPVPDLVANSNGGMMGNGGYELNTYSNNGMTYIPKPQAAQPQYHHQHQSSDTSMMMSGDSYDLYLQSGTYPDHQLYHQATMVSDNDGLYRAVMVPPPMVSQSSVIQNSGAKNNNTNTPSPSGGVGFTNLSAAQLYNQYLSHHDLRQQYQGQQQYQQGQQQGQRLSPDSFTNQRYIRQSPYDQQQQHQQAYVLGNPGAAGSSQEMYDDDVFHPPISQSQSTNHLNFYVDQHNNMYQQQQQPIYGMSTSTSKRSSPWSQATVVPNHHNLMMAHHATTPTPNMMIRYSPDEGYGEDGSSTTVTGGSAGQIAVAPIVPVGHLEGTEV